MTYVKGCVLLAAALLMARSTALAQGGQPGTGGSGSNRPIRFAFGGGVSVPTSDYKDALKNGFNGQGSLIFNLGGFPLALRADLNYNKFSFKDRPSFGGTPSSQLIEGNTQILGGLANITIPFAMGPVTPYVMAGLGAFNVKSEITSGLTGGQSDPDSETKFGINGGVGLALRLFGANAFIEGKLQNVYTDKGLIDKSTVQIIPVTFGFIF